MDQEGNEALSLLNACEKKYPTSPEEAKLEVFENKYSSRDYEIEFDCPEFTSLCPVTSQPDFGAITIRYIADKLCVESKSLKLYLYSFRNHNSFHEEVVNMILTDFVEIAKPRWIEVVGKFRPRGGIAINVRATYGEKHDWEAF